MELKIDEIVRKIEATTQDNQCYYLTDEGIDLTKTGEQRRIGF